MQKKYTLPLIIALSALILGAGIFLFNKKTAMAPTNPTITLFVSDTCPHCKNVEDFIAENKITEKISFDTKEVSKNPLNIKAFSAKGKLCNIKSADLGVPLLWDGEKCFSGDQEIINFFKEKAGIN